MSKFNPRNIPGRAHYDRLMTVAACELGKLGTDTLAKFQYQVTRRAKAIAFSDTADKFDTVIAMLAEIGFCAVIDHMADVMEQEQQDKGATP